MHLSVKQFTSIILYSKFKNVWNTGNITIIAYDKPFAMNINYINIKIMNQNIQNNSMFKEKTSKIKLSTHIWSIKLNWVWNAVNTVTAKSKL